MLTASRRLTGDVACQSTTKVRFDVEAILAVRKRTSNARTAYSGRASFSAPASIRPLLEHLRYSHQS